MTLNIIRDKVKEQLGKKVRVKYNGARNKSEIYHGKIVEIYNNIFIVKLKTTELKSISYTDILTNVIELDFLTSK